MYPQSKKIIKISNKIINKWHNKEHQISSFGDALKLLNKSNKKNNIFYHIEFLSLINTAQWHEEDKARDPNASDDVIAEIKRKIDRLNAMRVSKVEEIDSSLYDKAVFNQNAALSTETPASVIDKLIILCLKQYHMALEAGRKDSTKKLRNTCSEKLVLINKQIDDLISAYDSFVEEIASGKRRYALYRQFKMYNDPELNPVIYKNIKQNNAKKPK